MTVELLKDFCASVINSVCRRADKLCVCEIPNDSEAKHKLA